MTISENTILIGNANQKPAEPIPIRRSTSDFRKSYNMPYYYAIKIVQYWMVLLIRPNQSNTKNRKNPSRRADTSMAQLISFSGIEKIFI